MAKSRFGEMEEIEERKNVKYDDDYAFTTMLGFRMRQTK